MALTFCGNFGGRFVIFAFTAVISFIHLSHVRHSQNAVSVICTDAVPATWFDFLAVMPPKDIFCSFVKTAGKGHCAF